MIQKIILQVLQENTFTASLTEGEQMECIDGEFLFDISKEIEEELLKDLKSSSLFLIKYLCENYNPHVTAIITPSSIEVLESKESMPKIYDFILD